jgi:hypothetical protein
LNPVAQFSITVANLSQEPLQPRRFKRKKQNKVYDETRRSVKKWTLKPGDTIFRVMMKL